jgi:ATP-binding cassette subfamily C protein LapB
VLGLFQPSAGAILIDGIDLRQLDPAELRRNIGYVQQDTHLFFGTMRENLTVSAQHADDAAIVHAARIGGIDEFINMHPKGYDMSVGERGETLSGGQMQRVAIARSLMQEPKVLLADEPVASLDPESSNQVLDLISTIAREDGMTVLCSLHQVELAIGRTDRLIGLRDGQIVLDQLTAGINPAVVMDLYRRHGTSDEVREASYA